MEAEASISDAVHTLVLFVPCAHMYENEEYEAKLQKVKDCADLHGAFKPPTFCCWVRDCKLRQVSARMSGFLP